MQVPVYQAKTSSSSGRVLELTLQMPETSHMHMTWQSAFILAKGLQYDSMWICPGQEDSLVDDIVQDSMQR